MTLIAGGMRLIGDLIGLIADLPVGLEMSCWCCADHLRYCSLVCTVNVVCERCTDSLQKVLEPHDI